MKTGEIKNDVWIRWFLELCFTSIEKKERKKLNNIVSVNLDL